MKKYFLLICIFAVALSSCRKVVDDTTGYDAAAQAIADDQAIKDYFLSNGITNATKDPSGLYYTITAPGTGTHPTIASNITVGYSAYLLDGTLVDQHASSYFAPLSGLIDAWQIGIPKLAKGGSIILYVPSALGYGNTANGATPANTVLLFNITLQGFNN